MISPKSLPSFVLGFLTMIGGTVRFTQIGCKLTLVAGLGFGILLTYSGILINQKKKYKGNLIGAIISGLITLVMLQRIFATGFPTHLVTLEIVGFICFMIHMKQLLESKIVITAGGAKTSSLRWWQGFFLSSIFSLVYLFTPSYIISSLTLVCLQYPTRNISLIYATPLILSVIFPSTGMPFLAKYMTPMLDYFSYEEILETSNEDAIKMTKEGKNFILAMQPHGVISFCSLCSWVNTPPEIRKIKTGVASALLKFPILKHVMGIYSLTSASGRNIRKILKTKNNSIDGSVVLYTGGIAELFKSSRKEERLYLKNRKGFIKMALREGVDIIPVYLFGNTSCLTVLKNKLLASLSRKLQMSLTYFWGKWMLPIPRDVKLMYVRGKPLGLPHIPDPTDEDLEKWHTKYCDEVKRLFDSYKEKLPEYKHKTLHFD